MLEIKIQGGPVVNCLLRTIVIGYLLCAGIACSTSSQKEMDKKKPAALPPVEFKAQVDKATATVGDIVTLTLTVSSDPQLDVQSIEAGSKISGLRIVDAGEEVPRIIDTRKVIKKWFKLQPDIVGSYIIPPMTAAYKDKNGELHELKTAQIFIEVKSVLKDKNAGEARDIVDIKPLQSVPRPFGMLILYGAVIIFIVASGVLLFLYFRNKKKVLQEIPKPAHMLALEELEQLKREQLVEKGIVKEYYFRLSEIFRRYIERRFNIPAVERTTEELLPDMVNLKDCASSIKAETREILRSTDLVKYAKFSPGSSASEKDYHQVVHIIEETKETALAADNLKKNGPV